MAKLVITLAICFVFGGAALVKGFDKEAAFAVLAANAEDCKLEVGAIDSDVDDLVGKKPASTMEGKCLRSCLMKKYELMDANGKFNKEVALAHAQKYTEGSDEKMKIATEIIEKCYDSEVADDHCEAAEQYGICLHKEAVERNIKENYDF